MIISHSEDFRITSAKAFPTLNYKFRSDYISIGGDRIPYDSALHILCKKVGKTYEYKPCFGLKDIEFNPETDFYTDGFPYYMIALSDYMSIVEAVEKKFNLFDFVTSGILKEHLKGKDLSEVITNFTEMSAVISDDTLMLKANLQTLRGTNLNSSTKRLRRFISVMLYLYLYQKRDFFETFFSLLDYIQDMLEIDISSKEFGGKLEQVMENEASYYFSFLKFTYRSYSYKLGTVQNTVSNGRGISLSMFHLFYMQVYKKYANIASTNFSIINSDEYDDLLKLMQTRIRKCIGNDITATFLSRKDYGFKNIKQTYETCLKICDDSTNVPKTREKGEASTLRYNNEVVLRDIYENLLLYQKSLKYGNRPFKEIYENVDGKSMCYFNFTECREFLGSYLIMLYGGNMLTEKDTTPVDISMYTSKISNLEDALKNCQAELKSEQGKDSIIEDLKNQLQESNRILESKSQIIENLSEEVRSLNEQVQSIYSEDTIDEVIEGDEVSIEEMVEFLNDFKILLLGGRNNLLAKLSDYGINSMIQEKSQNKFQSTTTSIDFIVANTDFISHKLVYTAMERYKDKQDCLIHFRGTNPVALIKSCYDFINNWLN